MKNIALLQLSLAFVFTGASVWASSGADPLAFGELDMSHAGSVLSVTKGTPERTAISLTAPPITEQDTLVGFEHYRLYRLPGEPFEMVDGHPCIPQVTRLYRIPNTGAVELRVNAGDFELIENVDILPLQLDAQRFPANLYKDPSVYGQDGWYPAAPAVMSAPMIFRDFRVVSVTLYPVQVNPGLHQARIYRDLSTDILAANGPGENELLNPRRPSGVFAPLYRAQIANLDEHTLDEATDTPGSYLILCRDQWIPLQWADTLATWLRRRGYTVVIEAQATPTQTTMRNAVLSHYNDADPPLEFVCILGDPLASFGMPTGGTGGSGNYDHLFASLTADDIEDVGVGRLPATNAADFSTIFAKIMAYERTPYMDDPGWFHRAFLYAGTARGISANEATMLWGRQQFQRFTGVDRVTVATHSGYVNTTLVATRLNEGVSFFLWRGTWSYEMPLSCASECSNGSRLPVVFVSTCYTGDFDPGTSVSESWILAGSPSSLKGGVCGIGTATGETVVNYNNTVAGGFIYNICNLGVEQLGVALAGAKAQLYETFPSNSTECGQFSRWNNLMGEPSLSMWTDQPVVMNVTCPSTVNVGTRRVRLQVINQAASTPVEGALVVLWKGGECCEKTLSDEFGYADVPVTVLTPGIMTLTVTKRNHKPFLADITCVDSPQMVAFSSVTLDDDTVGGTQGNADGILNPGEIIDLPIYLRNFGTTVTAALVSATLASNHSGITVINGSARYPDIAPGDSAVCDTAFRISVSPTLKHNTSTVLTLSVNASGEVTHSSIPLICKAGEAVFESSQVIGGNGVLDPGETAQLRITARNVGALSMETVAGRLVSLSPYVTVAVGSASFGTIAVSATGSNAGEEFEIRANVHAYPGYGAAMMLILTTASGYIDTVTFAQAVGTRSSSCPTGPDAYGYFAYENSDTDYAYSRPYHYVMITGIGTNLGLNDPGGEPPELPTYSVLRNLPFTFRFYGDGYDRITVSSNGWAAFGDQHDLRMFRNGPIPGQQSPDALVAPFWDDLKTYGGDLGVWDYADADSHRYVIQWRARGAHNLDLQDFEVLLLDPVYYPTRDGNGIVVMQYASVSEMAGAVNDVPYSTVGIQAPGGLVGLQYRFNNTAAPGASALLSGRSIVFTTECYAALGNVAGTVVDAETQNPMRNVVVALGGSDKSDTTDAAGHYELLLIPAGACTVRASLAGFNDCTEENVVVPMDSTVTVNFSMLHPEIRLSVDHISVSLPTDPRTTFFDMINDGNGPLDYHITFQFRPSGALDSRWDYLTGFDVTAATGDEWIQGCELMDDAWWISGGGSQTGQKMLYKFDLRGHYARSVPQPSDSQSGWFDLATDGQLIYGSSSDRILGVDSGGAVQTSIPSPVNPARALAYDPQSDHFWVADYATDIFEITRDGTEYRHWVSPGRVTGLAWNSQDADGYRLYVFGRDSTGEHSRVYRMHPVSGSTQLLEQLDRRTGDGSGGCTVTGGWNSTLLVFAGVLQNANSDCLGIWELDFNTSWISVTPMFGSVPGGTTREMEMTFDPAILRDGNYYVNVIIRNNSATPESTLPVTLSVNLTGDIPAAVPVAYALHQNYPNPFNARTTFRYSLAQTGRVSLRIYNLLGQEVATVADGVQTTGHHTASPDLNDLPSGVYVYRLESGSFHDARKMVLIH
jgi:hypothetical protein